MKDINTKNFEEINIIENFKGRGGGGRSVSPRRIGGRSVSPRRRGQYYRRPYYNNLYYYNNLGYYNPYYNLFPLYADSGTVIYNSINDIDDECRDKCFKQCKSDDLKCLANCYLDCKDEKENFETTSNTFNRKHLLFLIIVILLFFILMK